MTLSRPSAQSLEVSRNSRWRGESSVASSSSVIPTIPVSGVRSS